MLSTPCQSCQFISKEEGVCRANLHCVRTADGQVQAPGFCRVFTKRTGELGESLDVAVAEARARTALRFDLIVLFDERTHSSEQLRRTIRDASPRMSKLIIVDTTGHAFRQSVAKGVLRDEDVPYPYSLDCLVNPEDSHKAATDWAIRLVGAPYFITLEAGRVLQNIDALADHLRDVDSRVIHWHFPIRSGQTNLVSRTGPNAAWITAAYRQMGGNMSKCIFEKLDMHEKASGLTLSYLLDEVEVD